MRNASFVRHSFLCHHINSDAGEEGFARTHARVNTGGLCKIKGVRKIQRGVAALRIKRATVASGLAAIRKNAALTTPLRKLSSAGNSFGNVVSDAGETKIFTPTTTIMLIL